MRSHILGLALLSLTLVPVFAISISEKTMKPTEVKKITTILFAEELEPCIKFWTERLGFQKTMEVPEGNKIGFAIVEKNGLELMYQSFASAEKDNAATGAAARRGPSFLYIDVADLDAALEASADDVLSLQGIRN
jgi:uncharacterized glyoxalase superfamily protein PhnB